MKILLLITILFICATSLGQSKIELNKQSWSLKGKATNEVYKGEDCIKTDGGSALAENLIFHNGIIEFDMCIQEGRGFAGVRFRGDGNNNTEEFYIRKHQSGNPDAMQYTPVFNGNAGWQLYHGDGYSATKKHVFDEWFHVKLVISGIKGEVFIGDMEKPILAIHELKMGDCKGLVEVYGPARFANIRIKEVENPALLSEFKDPMQAGPETIQKYSISEPVKGEDYTKLNKINDKNTGLQFKEGSTELNGLLNISKYTLFSREKNTVLLKIKVDAKEAAIKELKVAFSDAAKIYVNGKATWQGVDNFRSRDYRYLGTIGYFDSVFLDLKKGDNIVTVAVSESFGGWGFKGMFTDLKGIKIQ